MSNKSHNGSGGGGGGGGKRKNNDNTGGFIRASAAAGMTTATTPSTTTARKRRLPPNNTISGNNTKRSSSTARMTKSSSLSSKKKPKISNPNNAPYVNTQNNNNDVPQIKGVSPFITPLLLSTIKAYKKYYTKLSKLQAHQQQHEEETKYNNSRTSTENEKNDILNRIKQQNDNVQNDPQYQKINELKLKSHESIKSFIKTLKQEMMLKPSSSQHENKQSVAVACLLFSLNLLQDPAANINLCRAVLQVIKELLTRGSDCRTALFSDDSDELKLLVDVIAAKRTTDSNNENSDGVQMFQKEALEMLQHLHELYNTNNNNKNENYPRLHVAMRYLEERKGILLHNGGQTHTGVGGGKNVANQLRHDRDVAIQYGSKQQKVILKIIKRIDVCFDVLVPRLDDPFGVGAAEAVSKFLDSEQQLKSKKKAMTDAVNDDSASKKNSEASISPSATTRENKESDTEDDDDSDDDDIDWEEGNEGDVFDTDAVTNKGEKESLNNPNDDANDNNDATLSTSNTTNITEATQQQHKDAVEQTLAVMESTGGIVGGEMEINFDANQNDEDVTYHTNAATLVNQSLSADATAAVIMAKTTLQKCVNLLSYRYMPRLSVWVDALITADGLTTVQPKQNDDENNGPSPPEPIPTSLVLLSSSMRKKRKITLQMLMSLKADVASVISSAGRLGIVPGGDKVGNGEGQQSNGIDINGGNRSINSTAIHSRDEGCKSSSGKDTDTHNLSVAASSSSATTTTTTTSGVNHSTRNTSKTSEPLLHTQNWKAALGLSTNRVGKHAKSDDKSSSLKHRLSLQGKGIHAKRKKRKVSSSCRLQIKYRST